MNRRNLADAYRQLDEARYRAREARLRGVASISMSHCRLFVKGNLHLPRPPVQLQTVSTEAARKLVIEHDKGLAKEIGLDIVMRKPIDSD